MDNMNNDFKPIYPDLKPVKKHTERSREQLASARLRVSALNRSYRLWLNTASEFLEGLEVLEEHLDEGDFKRIARSIEDMRDDFNEAHLPPGATNRFLEELGSLEEAL
jgi:hypothetical protein